MQELKQEELFKIYELPNYYKLLRLGFISQKAECYRTYIEYYNLLIEKGENKYVAIRETASKFKVSRRTVYRYLELEI